MTCNACHHPQAGETVDRAILRLHDRGKRHQPAGPASGAVRHLPCQQRAGVAGQSRTFRASPWPCTRSTPNTPTTATVPPRPRHAVPARRDVAAIRDELPLLPRAHDRCGDFDRKRPPALAAGAPLRDLPRRELLGSPQHPLPELPQRPRRSLSARPATTARTRSFPAGRNGTTGRRSPSRATPERCGPAPSVTPSHRTSRDRTATSPPG